MLFMLFDMNWGLEIEVDVLVGRMKTMYLTCEKDTPLGNQTKVLLMECLCP